MGVGRRLVDSSAELNKATVGVVGWLPSPQGRFFFLFLRGVGLRSLARVTALFVAVTVQTIIRECFGSA